MTEREQQVEHRDETEQTLLEAPLQELAELEWKREADRARSIALKRGIDQQMIDDAVKELRYGRCREISPAAH